MVLPLRLPGGGHGVAVAFDGGTLGIGVNREARLDGSPALRGGSVLSNALDR